MTHGLPAMTGAPLSVLGNLSTLFMDLYGKGARLPSRTVAVMFSIS